MDNAKLQAWWWHRQGLDGSLTGASPADVLERAGWARSVGGVGPYVTLFARAGTTREQADKAVAKLAIHELPAARGCTYVVPASDYALALTVAREFGAAELKTAEKLGVTAKEIEKLCDVVATKLGDEPLDVERIRELAGSASRSLGEEGKKKGMTTTLPIALGLLQTSGQIRRVPMEGRLDQQRYRYARWSPSPLGKKAAGIGEPFTELARKYFTWVGPATMKEFQWFSGLGVAKAKEAAASLGLVPVEGTDRLMLPDDAKAFAKFKAPTSPQYALVSSLDAISAARRDVGSFVDAADQAKFSTLTFGERAGSNVVDLSAHAILDRGRLLGYWEFDPEAGEVVWMTFSGKADKALKNKIAEMEAYVRDQLGDARSFSLDSPKSRKPKLEILRKA